MKRELELLMGSKLRPKIIQYVLQQKEPVSLRNIQMGCEVKSYNGVHKEVGNLVDIGVLAIDRSGKDHLVSLSNTEFGKKVASFF